MPSSGEPLGRVLVWIETLPHPSWTDAVPDAVVCVDPSKFDVAWMRSDQWVSPGGLTGAQGQRYRRIGEWIEAGNSIAMCEASNDDHAVCFINGRHRFAWLRDRGVRAMPMQVPPSEAEWFEKEFGTPLRVSILSVR